MHAVDVACVAIVSACVMVLFAIAFVDVVFWNGAVIRELKRRGW